MHMKRKEQGKERQSVVRAKLDRYRFLISSYVMFLVFCVVAGRKGSIF